VKGQFLGQNVEWLFFRDLERKFYLKEQKNSGGKIEEGLIIHIAMLSDQPESIEEMTKLIEGIKLVEK
jgi:hypothetical protein